MAGFEAADDNQPLGRDRTPVGAFAGFCAGVAWADCRFALKNLELGGRFFFGPTWIYVIASEGNIVEHTEIISASELEEFANTIISEGVVPELVCMLIRQSVDDITTCRIPYGAAINQTGLDGLVESHKGFREFVPPGKSYWEIGTGGKPQVKATRDFKKRTADTSVEDRRQTSFVFVTPCGWPQPAQIKWLSRRKSKDWREVKILDGVQLSEWLREFPSVGKWLSKRMGIAKSSAGFSTPAEHWGNSRGRS